MGHGVSGPIDLQQGRRGDGAGHAAHLASRSQAWGVAPQSHVPGALKGAPLCARRVRRYGRPLSWKGSESERRLLSAMGLSDAAARAAAAAQEAAAAVAVGGPGSSGGGARALGGGGSLARQRQGGSGRLAGHLASFGEPPRACARSHGPLGELRGERGSGPRWCAVAACLRPLRCEVGVAPAAGVARGVRAAGRWPRWSLACVRAAGGGVKEGPPGGASGLGGGAGAGSSSGLVTLAELAAAAGPGGRRMAGSEGGASS
jgi:hypothetical protein